VFRIKLGEGKIRKNLIHQLLTPDVKHFFNVIWARSFYSIAFNLINVLRARFLYESAFVRSPKPKNVTRKSCAKLGHFTISDFSYM